MSKKLKEVDHSGLIFNQIMIMLLNVLAFIFNLPWLAGIVTAGMLIGTLIGVPGFGFIYRFLLRPAGLVKAHVLTDNPEPHRFAQGFGGTVMLAGTILLLTGAGTAGWVLVWLVTALAVLNAFAGFCVGCFIYYWFSRLGIPGFQREPPAGTFPGRRPKRSAHAS
jgi:hypothetical protein